MRTHRRRILTILMLALLSIPSLGYAGDGENVSYIARGASRMVGGLFAIPKSMMQDSTRVMFPFGLVTGAARGTMQTVTGVLGGTVDVARGAAPYAKYLVFM